MAPSPGFRRTGTSSPSGAAMTSSASRTCPAPRSRCHRIGVCCSRAPTHPMATSRTTRPSGSGRPASRPRTTTGGCRTRAEGSAPRRPRDARPIGGPPRSTRRVNSVRGEHPMRSTTRRPAAALAALAVVAATLLAACNTAASPSPSAASSAAASPGSSAAASQGTAHEPVSIVVGALRPGVTQAAADALFEQIKEFEAKYPWITVKPEEYNWEAPTFTAALAAGTLPDVFTIPFTDGKGLIAQHQITDIDALVRALGYADKFNPSVLVNGQDKDGKIYAVPTAAYGMSLTYNRSLFTKAGLDPDKPPTTWDEVQAAAKTIAETTGVAGYAEMATANTGGWQLTTLTYALGGRMETLASDGKVTATLDNTATKSALEKLKAMRWSDDSMGSTFDYAWGSINQACSSGQVGMFTGG